jgi:uncharacterized protein with FMN-binding domain
MIKAFSKLTPRALLIFTLLIIGSLSLAPVLADDGQSGEGQISGGEIYFIKDETTNGAYAPTVQANACDDLRYKAMLYNPGPGFLQNVMVQATLPSSSASSNTSTLTASSVNAMPGSTSANATANFSSSQSVSYQSGTTELLDQNNNLIKNLPDGVTSGGVSIGDLAASTIEFVQFDVKVNCPSTPPVYTCNALGVTVGDNRTVQVTNFSTTATNGAVFNNAVIDWGDNSAPLTSANPVGQTHQYAADGTYTVSATAHFTVNGQDVTASGPNCVQQVTITTVPPPTYTCNALGVTVGDDRTVNINAFSTTATNGAVFKDAVIDWGDGATPLTSSSPVGQTHQYAADGTYTISATAHFTVNGQDVTASGPGCVQQVTIKTPPPPVYTCNELGITTEDDRNVEVNAFNTTATNGAVFKDAVIDWGDNSTPLTSASPVGQMHQYAADGTYTISATAHFTVNGQDVTASGPNCVQQVTIKTPPHVTTPVYTCNALGVTADTSRTININAFNTTATNGAVFNNAVIDWGDNTTPLTSASPVGQTHQYAADGTYTVTATAHFTVNGQDVTASGVQCQQKVTFSTPAPTPPVTPTPPAAIPPATPPATPAAAPTALVNTGPGSIVGLFAATTIVGTVAYRWFLSRRLSRS